MGASVNSYNMTAPEIEIAGHRVPTFLYGTAWKEERTQGLTAMALKAGFRGVDTANQRKHYYEAGAGAAIIEAMATGMLNRDDLFLQTKFTYQRGQDHRLPYDPEGSPQEQVRQSFRSSLEHLGVDYLDSYVLHGPSLSEGLTEVDWAVWREMEALHKQGLTHFLGVSNISLSQLKSLCEKAEVLPTFVQNRCYARTGWDKAVRQFCLDNGMLYQGFSLLTANRKELAQGEFLQLAQRLGRTPAQVVFRFALQVGMLPLTGTSNADHMAQDRQLFDFELSDAEVEQILTLTSRLPAE